MIDPVRCLLVTAGLLSSAGMLAGQARPGSQGAEAHEQAAHRYLAEKRPEMAVPEFRAVLAAEPGNLDAQANLGVLLYFQGDNAGAAPLLRAAVAQKPELVKIQALLGLAEKSLGQAKEAQADLQAAVPGLTEAPIRVQAGLALVELDVAAGEGEKAAGVIALLRQVAPTDPQVLYAAYRIYTDLAGEALLSLSLAAPESAQMHQATAHELEKARDQAGAIANLRKAAEINPQLPGVHYELAEALRGADNPALRAEAEGEYRKAVAQNPKDARSMVALGDAAADRSDAKAASMEYEAALRVDSQLPEALIGMARMKADGGDAEGAVPLLQQAIAADPTNGLAHFRLSAVYRKLHRPEDAKRELAQYQRLKELKERMRTVYKQMREEVPNDSASGTPGQPR